LTENADSSELAAVDVRMSATLHPLTSTTDMTSLAEIQNTFPPYASNDGILHNTQSTLQLCRQASIQWTENVGLGRQ